MVMILRQGLQGKQAICISNGDLSDVYGRKLGLFDNLELSI